VQEADLFRVEGIAHLGVDILHVGIGAVGCAEYDSFVEGHSEDDRLEKGAVGTWSGSFGAVLSVSGSGGLRTGLYLGFVPKYMFSIGLAVSVPLIAMAYAFRNIEG
jgi:hypothetical protein